ncbi:alkaline phosphatase synthesis transcriptional regulatory protein PhoP [Mesobacillus boroniphilus JCM 21738]|uniref:Alkaline phosphatase synthesis transcriptional regulatory protein PhoP n=1 Tax=Mesobacillus boroniphilus JCM 21738 TaxID=1294265 RepID=W4RU90_9BACI|nr:alkaline phosphatase synthesis transcriptional regulatory protein PhoP [Mesobacillus boroniphilus JCM 21738]
MNKKVLVVDDEQSIVTLLKYNLEQNGYSVVTGMDGEEGIRLAADERPDLMILDLMLPKLDGMEVCKQLRQQKINVPILMLTAKDDEFDKVLGLELGADDYMTKPFSPREVVARVKAILRRTQTQPKLWRKRWRMRVRSRLVMLKSCRIFMKLILWKTCLN